jgi:alkanesulfonate monooxygenase SsuD/methylene tetrahydromethanopterin reductase-like flavin-dependent oxidoreductase (luciferase family)
MNRGERADEFIQVIKKIWTDDIVEFKGKYYNIPASKIGPKPVQKPHIPIYVGGFSSNTFSRIVKQDLRGWLGVINGPLAQLQDSRNAIKRYSDQMNKDSKNF